MKTFLIVLLVAVVFVVGQVLFLQPSRHEKRVMALRSRAREQGLQVRLLAPPEWYKGERVAGGLLACYSLFAAEGSKPLQRFRAEKQADGYWQVKSGNPAALEGLLLPAEADALLAIEVETNAISLWWTESLGEEALPAFFRLLSDLFAKTR